LPITRWSVVKLFGVVIETERLRMRPLTAGDLDELVALHAEPEVMRFWGPFDRVKLIEWVQLTQRDWADRGCGRVAIIERATGRVLGRTGLKYLPEFGETEVGWVLHPDVWGCGFATEAARACAEWGFEELEVPYLTSMIDPENSRSIAVAERLGMTPLRNDVLLGDPVVVYSISREQWTATADRLAAPLWRLLERDGVRLACRDFGGHGPNALLLHGLAGHAGEWEDTAGWLTGRCRVVALDERGHGRSERAPASVSREAHIADAVFVIEQLRLAPVILVGQSLGGHLALLIAARRPDLVRGLAIAEASPAGGDLNGVRETVETVGHSLARWPVPFPDQETAVDYFGGPSLTADAWAAGLEARHDGLWPCFDVEVMQQTLREAISQPRWQEWERIRCPTLIVRAGSGTLDPNVARAMTDRLPQAQLAEIPDAAHDLHLDRPAEWRAALTGFLDTLDQHAG
jgi:pimeloyl-ACP methyl ester carboxylesterase/RimJ/RimL family protein N-acetyltransferase